MCVCPAKRRSSSYRFRSDSLFLGLSLVDVALRVAERGEEPEERGDADRDQADHSVDERDIAGLLNDPAADERARRNRRPR
jgi:hypothetical protein